MKPKFEEDVKEEVTEEYSATKKILAIITGIFIAVLIISFVFVNFPIADILAGRSESKIISNNTINLGNFSIVLENGTYDELRLLYFDNPKTEIAACLIGKKEGSFYLIESLYIPKIYSKTFSEVIFGPCSNSTIIMLHSHPYQHCIASDTDINTLNQTKQENPNIIMVIMCEAKRFAVYS